MQDPWINITNTMSEKHLRYLDGWRGLAIVFLLVGHFFPVPGLGFGAVGVNLFYVLSGLLMARLLFVDQVPIPTFYRRRIARVMPGLFVFIFLVLLAYVLTGSPISWSEVATAVTFTKNYFLAPAEDTLMPFGHIWSLSVEEHSYILLTLVAVWTRKRGTNGSMAVLGVAALCVCFAGFYEAGYSDRALNLKLAHSEVAAFGIFFSGGLFLLLRQLRLPRLPAVLYLGLAIFAVALHWWRVPAGVRTLAGVAVFAVVVNLLVVAPPTVLRLLENSWLRKLGLWSFSIYIWQQPFYLMVHHGKMPALAGLVLGVVAGAASYHLVESPARTYLNRHWGSKKAPPLPSTQPAA